MNTEQVVVNTEIPHYLPKFVNPIYEAYMKQKEALRKQREALEFEKAKRIIEQQHEQMAEFFGQSYENGRRM